ncbi:MAG: glycosyltransferase family 39 protein [Verrucomicrobiales bacterium]|nr:glycosyltransferase family 39 protein [Verrucomicrobiales bacterium]
MPAPRSVSDSSSAGSWWRSWWPLREDESRSGRRSWTVVLLALLVLLGGIVWAMADDWPRLLEKAAQRGRPALAKEFGPALLWKAMLVNAGLTLVLLATLPWWAGPNSLAGRMQEGDEGEARWLGWRWRRVVVGLLLLVGLLVRLPRLEQSLYNDEAHNYVRLFSGNWELESPEQEPVFKPVTWVETVWRNSNGSNSQPFSILARACLDGAKKMGWAEPGEVVEWAVRLPSLVAGLLTVALLGGMAGRRLGRGAGVAVLGVGALHPWMVMYGTEARGHALMLLGLALAWWGLDKALRRGRWVDWLTYGAGIFVAATAFIGCVYHLVVLSASLMLGQLWRWRRGTVGWDQVVRPVVASVLAAMAGLQLMLPILPDLMRMLKEYTVVRGVMGLDWWQNTTGLLLTGCNWNDLAAGVEGSLALERWALSDPVWMVALALLVVTMGLGSWELWRRGGAPRRLLVAAAGGWLLAWLVGRVQGMLLMRWYTYFTLAWAVVAIGAGLVVWLRRSGWQRVIGGLAVVACGAIFLRADVRLMHWGKQQERAPVVRVRGGPYPESMATEAARQPLTAAFWANGNVYDPMLTGLRSVEDLQALMKLSRLRGRPLWVSYAHRGAAARYSPELLALVEEGGEFERMEVFLPLEDRDMTTYLYRLKETPAAQ